MSGHKPFPTSPLDAADTHETDTSVQNVPSDQQLRRTAELVANGDLPLPLDLPDEQLAKLVREVQERRRRRLVHFVARAIAMDIVSGNGQGGQADDA